MKPIAYSDFPLDEYRGRVNRLQAAMDACGVDALVITDPANLRYIFGFQNLLQLSATRMFVGLFPKDRPDEAALFIPHDCQDAPQSWVENVVFWDEGHEPPFDDRMADVELVARRLMTLGLHRGRIGLEVGPGTRPGLPAEQFDRLRALLGGADLIDCAPLLWSLRVVKSEAEIDLLRTAGQASARAIEAALVDLRAGMSERELYRQVQARIFGDGLDGQGLLCVQFGVDGWRRANMAPTDARKLARDEWAYVDGGGMLQGYYADVCRMGVLGKANSRQTAIYEAVREAEQATIDAIRPGVPCSELYGVATDAIKRAGFGEMIDSLSVGHGIGLNIHEMPDLNASNHEPLQAGMVLSIEPWVLDRSPDVGLFNVEDMVVVREGGAELLSSPVIQRDSPCRR